MTDFFDYQKLVPTLGAQQPAPRFRLGVVSAINADRTINVTIAGASTVISSVKYLGNVQPLPNAGVWLVSDGFDVFAFGVIAGADRTFAPRMYRETDQNITDSTDTVVGMSAVESDSWSSWNGTNRLVAKMAGRYMAVGQVTFAANATGFRAAWIEKNGTTVLGRIQVPAVSGGSPTWLSVSTQAFSLAVGDYVNLNVRQNSTGTLAISATNTNTPSLTLVYLGP